MHGPMNVRWVVIPSRNETAQEIGNGTANTTPEMNQPRTAEQYPELCR